MEYLVFLLATFSFNILLYIKYRNFKTFLSNILNSKENQISTLALELSDLRNSFKEALSANQNLLNEKSKLKDNFHQIITDLNKEVFDLSKANSELESDLVSQDLLHKKDLKEKVAQARKDAVDKSRSVIRGQATEHLAPYILKDTNPKDYRFMGNPIDYVCFEGLSDVLDKTSDQISCVHFIDIKTGKSNLNKSQRRIRDAIKEGRVKFTLINLDEEINNYDNQIKEKPNLPSKEKS